MAMQLSRNIFFRYFFAGPFAPASGASFAKGGTPLASRAARRYTSVPLAKDQGPRHYTETGKFLLFVGSTIVSASFFYWIDYGYFRKDAKDRKAENQRIRQEVEELEFLLESERLEIKRLNALLGREV